MPICGVGKLVLIIPRIVTNNTSQTDLFAAVIRLVIWMSRDVRYAACDISRARNIVKNVTWCYVDDVRL